MCRVLSPTGIYIPSYHHQKKRLNVTAFLLSFRTDELLFYFTVPTTTCYITFSFSQDGVVRGVEANHTAIYKMMESQEQAIVHFLLNQRALRNSSAWEPYLRIVPKHVPSVRM